jgi:hypothetical protein
MNFSLKGGIDSVTCLSGLVVGASLVSAQPPAPSRQELAAAVSEASRRYITAIAAYQCEQQGESWEVGNKDKVFRSTVRCRQRDQLGLMVITSTSGTTVEGRATGVNSRYSFELRQNPGKGWVLAEFREIGPEPHEVFPLLGIQSPVCRALAPYWLDEGYWLPDLLSQESKDVHIGPISRLTQDGVELVRVGYAYPDRHSPGVAFKGHVDLLPARQWVVAGWVNERTLKGVARRTVLEREFDTATDGLPLPRHEHRLVTVTIPGSKGRESVTDYKYAKEKADPSEFRLTAFGLPEPPGVKWERPTPTYVWVLVAAMGFGTLAVLFRHLARRRSATPPTG